MGSAVTIPTQNVRDDSKNEDPALRALDIKEVLPVSEQDHSITPRNMCHHLLPFF